MKYKLQDLIDMDHFQNLQDRLNEIYSFPSAILDIDGNILTATAWQDICTKFHRKNKESEQYCVQSDKYILSHLNEANPAVSYRCPHGLVDNATPIIIDGIHYGNFFTGQFFLEKPDIEFFRAQAKKYSFDEGAYLEAVNKVPIWTKKQLNSYIFFIKGLITIISESGLKKLKEIEARKQIEENEKRSRSIIENSKAGYFFIDNKGLFRDVNSAWLDMHGYDSAEEVIGHHYSMTQVESELPKADNFVDKVLKGNSLSEMEFARKRKDGTVGYHTFTLNPVERNGKIIGLEGFLFDITERKKVEQERLAHLRFVESMDKVNRAIQGAHDVDSMMSDVLDTVLSIFDCDRVWLFYPCDPDAPSFRVPMEITKPEYQGAKIFNVDVPMPQDMARNLQEALESADPLTYTVGTEKPINKVSAEQFGVKSMMIVALYPKLGKPWAFGLHQCSYPRVWISEEERLFQEIGRRLADALTSLLAYRDLQESEEKYRLLIENSHDIIYTITPDGVFTFVSPAWTTFLGHPIAQVVGHSFKSFIHPDDVVRCTVLLKTTLETGQRQESVEYRVRHTDGTWRWHTSSAVPLRDKIGTIVGLEGIARDITDRKRAEEEVRASRQIIEEIINAIPVRVFWKDKNLVFLGCNKIFSLDAGFNDPKDIIGKDDFQMGWRDQAELYQSDDRQVIESGCSKLLIEEPQTTPEGKTITLLTSKIPLRSHNGEIIGVLGTYMDITERKWAEEALHRLNRKLQAISNCNQILLRAVDEQTLLNEICRIICDEAGYRLAWVGYAEYDEAKTLRPVAWAGFDNGYIANVNITWGDNTERGQGPAGKVIRSGEIFYVQDFTTDPQMAPWCESALQRGYHSGIALPLKDESAKVFGVLLIYSVEANSITPDEIQLMDDLARDLAFGIVVLRDRAKHKQAEEALLMKTHTLETVFESAPYIMMLVNEEGRVTDINRLGVRFSGMEKDELFGLLGGEVFGCLNSFDGQGCGKNQVCEFCPVRGRVTQTFQTGEPVFEGRGRLDVKKDGIIVMLELLISTVLVQTFAGRQVLVTIADITERMRAQEMLRESEEKFSKVFLHAPGLITLSAVEDGRYIDVNDTFVRISGFTREEAVGKTSIELGWVSFEDRSRMIDELKMHGRIAEMELVHHAKDQRPITCLYHGELVVIEGKERLLSIALDITDRKRAEIKITESGRLLNSVLESNPEIILFALDNHYRYLIFNNKHKEVMKNIWGKEIAVGTNMLDEVIGSHSDREKAKRNFDRALKGESFVLNEEYGDKRLSRLYWEDMYSPIYSNEGNIIGLTCFVLDITERKRMEMKLENERILLKTILDNIPIAVYAKDVDGRKVLANQTDLDGIGKPESEVIGHTDMEFLPYEVAERTMADDLLVIKDGEQLINREELIINNTGEQFWLLTSKIPWYNLEGKIVGLVGVGHNITERKLIEADRERMTAAIEQAGEIIVITDTNGAIQYVNPAFEYVTGYIRGEVIGQNPRILKGGKQDEAFYRNLWQTISGGEVWKGRFINKRKDGKLYTEEATISPVRDGAGNIVNYVAVKNDITAQLALEQQLYQAQKMESVGKLAGGVAHDFNNILTIILANAEMALMSIKSGYPVKEEINNIKDASLRAADLTRQLLAFARKQTITPKVLNLNDTIDGMLKILRRLIGEDIDLVWKPEPNLWSVKVDPSQVDQILANLSVNARDAINGVGNLTIETENVAFDETYCANHPDFIPAEYVMLAVSDTGSGMDAKTLEQIFDPFFTTKEVGKGTGLGLATVYGVVKQNSGFINVYSEPGIGTTFKIYLPRVQTEAMELTEVIDKQPSRGTETILLAEDEIMILNLGKNILEQYGYTVLAARTPNEALVLAHKHNGPIHLLVTDVVMPGMNGRDLRDKLTVRWPEIKTLFMSGYTANVIAHHGVLDEDVHFLQKPFSVNSLALKVREVLDM